MQAQSEIPGPRSGAKATPAYQWLLFDADGTLFDYERAEAEALKQAFQQNGLAFDAGCLTSYQQINRELWQCVERGELAPGVLKVRRFELLFEALGMAHSASRFSGLYLDRLAECSELIAGAAEVLAALHGRYRFAIVTNGLHAVQRSRVARSAIRGYIDVMIISEEIGCAKPAREFFDVTFGRLGRPPVDEVLMIGDNWASDIQGAARYGLATCWYNPARQPRPDSTAITREIASLNELLDWLG
jgi:2-haloacid dehalogenase